MRRTERTGGKINHSSVVIKVNGFGAKLELVSSHSPEVLNMKYIVVTGGVVSGLGKGVTISSIGRILKNCGVRTTSIKIDPYINVDAGTMSPFEHGEVFVLDDGGEVDLDLGNYERFLNIRLSRNHNITTGKVYSAVVNKERRGDYLGKTVQVVPHITDEILSWIEKVSKIPVDGSGLSPDVCLIEVGGTVGDIESMIFLEALRQFQFRIERENMCLVHVSLVPTLGTVGEQKTKPTQHGIKELRSVGLHPDIICCRSIDMLEESTRKKISIFCQVPVSNVFTVHDVSSIYQVPLNLVEQNMHNVLRDHLKLNMGPLNMAAWNELAFKVDSLTNSVNIAIVGKYTGLQDSYLSVIKALKHSAISSNRSLEIKWIDATTLEESTKLSNPHEYSEAWSMLHSVDGIVIPGGFGVRGVEGKIETAKFARINKKPILGICLGFQCMVIEFCRNVLGLESAHSTEFDEHTPNPVVIFMPEISKEAMGGTMRLGARKTILSKNYGSGFLHISELYNGADTIQERHRHRYEVNPAMVSSVEENGLYFIGKDETSTRMEICSLPRPDHPFFVGTQFHPEFLSRPLDPAPLFLGLVLAATNQLDEFLRNSPAQP